jgi:carnitine monooxygenase subunit
MDQVAGGIRRHAKRVNISSGREQLEFIARRNRELTANGDYDLADDIVSVPASNYFAHERWAAEMEKIFKRLPLTLAFTAELSNPGDYKAMDVAGTPVLITRGAGGQVRAFVNSCSHRGAIIVSEGTGNARRFTCPYHAWSYDQQGDLVGIFERELFGDLDTSCHGLTPLAAGERAGLIFVTLDPRATDALDLDSFLCGYDEVLSALDLANCRVVGRQSIEGPNWKVAYDGYLDLYHLPILHRITFGPNIGNKAVYYPWGPHQRVSSLVPRKPIDTQQDVTASDPPVDLSVDLPIEQWPIDRLTLGVWTIFPHISIASFEAMGRVFLVSQLFPGDTPGSSVTVQTFLHSGPDAPGQADKIRETMAFLHHVVQDEDYFTGLRLQRALMTGAKSHVMFGRNEGGGQRFHRWVDALLETPDEALVGLFSQLDVQ